MLIAALIAIVLAAVAAVAVLLDRARSEAAGLRLLVEMSGLMQVTTSSGDAVEIVPVFGRRLFPAVDGALYVANGSRFELAASWGDTTSLARVHAFDCGAARLSGPHAVASEEPALFCEVADGAALCVPLLSARETIGILTLRAANGSALESRTALFGRTFADHVSVALANLRMQEALRASALRDSLTGAFNRRYMEETLAHELRESRTRGTRTGVIVVDVDRFKWINDNYGHGGGDAILTQIARAMQTAFNGPREFVCRYGGDEFVVVVPMTAADTLYARAERLRESLHDLRVHADGRILGSITISTGLAVGPDHGESVHELIAAADRALYSAKTAGRDRVASPPPHAIGLDAA